MAKDHTLTVQAIAQLIDGQVIAGNSDVLIEHLASIREATAGSATFVANPMYEQYVYTTQASVVIVPKNFQTQYPVSASLIAVADPYVAFNTLLAQYHALQSVPTSCVEEPSYLGRDVILGEDMYRGAFSYIGDGAHIGNGVQIYPHVYIGAQVVVGEHTIIYSGAKIYPRCTIGSNCIIHAGAVIGSDGFGFVAQKTGAYTKMPHIGNVIVKDDVEIGANTTVDRATTGSTVIHEGTKIDNLVQIGHNVTIGSDTVVAALTGIAGSASIGNRCTLGGQVGVAGHIAVGDQTMVAGKAGVTKSYKDGNITLMGMPAIERKQFIANHLFLKQLQKQQSSN